MKVLIVLLVVTFTISQANSLSQLEDWRNFKFQHGKKYKNEVEDKVRMKIFQQNKQKIKMHNAQYKKGLVSYEQGINKYCDMLPFEFVKTFNGFNRTGTRAYHKNVIGKKFSMPADENLPDAVDWREKGAVTPVKDQQRCGACWAFASTGALEGQEFIKKGKLISLSEQNLIDCSKKYGNNGCDGGLMDNSFTYIKDNDGIDTEKSYPYEARDGQCRYNLRNSAADDTGFIDLDAGDEKKLMAAVATVGPIAVGIDASHESLQRYKRGIYYEPNCSSTDLDHAVLVVGYGVDENNKKYWIVKNSWSRSWGEGGYFKMPRDENNYCGIATAPSYPVV